MPFKFNPQPIPDDFIWSGKYFHLTYKGFLDKTVLLNQVANTTSTPLTGWSIVHEISYQEDPEGYEHTHFAMIFKARIRLHGSRKFDVCILQEDGSLLEILHPHVQPHVSIVAMEAIISNYHAGRKYNVETGSYVYTEPIYHEYKLPPMFDFSRAAYEEMVSAPSLFEACLAGGIRPRTVNDVKTLRDEAASHDSKRFKHMYDPSSFKDLAPANWSVLHIWGGTGLGKTKYAVAQFRNPCLIKPFDSVGCLEALAKQFDPELHDGLVLDEADFRFMTRQQVIAFFDQDEPCTLNVRYKAFTLPPNLKKIVVSNPPPKDLYPADPAGAIQRRRTCLKITAPTWHVLPNVDATPPTALMPNLAYGPMGEQGLRG